jgi:DNA-binding NarL/FixJ family response regulator
MSGTRTLIRADASEVQVVFAAVVEAVAGGRRAIYTLKPARRGNGSGAGDAGIPALTNREAQVVRLIASGLDTSDIAARLHVSPNTVRSHVRNAMSKLSARTRAQLVAQALGGDSGPAPGER